MTWNLSNVPIVNIQKNIIHFILNSFISLSVLHLKSPALRFWKKGKNSLGWVESYSYVIIENSTLEIMVSTQTPLTCSRNDNLLPQSLLYNIISSKLAEAFELTNLHAKLCDYKDNLRLTKVCFHWGKERAWGILHYHDGITIC